MGRRSRHKIISGAILFAGLALLAIGVASAVARHNRSVEENDVEAAALEAKYAKALETADQSPQFEVSYVRFPLSDLGALTTGGAGRPVYEVVPTEVADRIRAGGRQLHPAFGAMRTDYPSHAAFARAYREHRVRNEGIFVAALLVTQTIPGKVAELRLDVVRVPVTKLEEIYDLTDVIRAGTEASRPHRAEVVRWRPSAKAGALVPLSLLHAFRISNVSEGLQLTSVAMLVPRRLFVRGPSGTRLEVDIRSALESPLDLRVGR